MSETGYIYGIDLSVQYTIADTLEARTSYLFTPSGTSHGQPWPQETVQAGISGQSVSFIADHAEQYALKIRNSVL